MIQLNAFADYKIDVNEKLKKKGREEIIVGIEENTAKQHFLLFPQYVQKTCIADT